MKNPPLLLGLLLAVLGSLLPAHADAPALSNPFGVFNLRPFNELPAQRQVEHATVPFATHGWATIILPLNEGYFDPRPYLTALASHGYQGPIVLHNFGFKGKPEAYLPASMHRWRELSAEVAKVIATNPNP